MEFRKAESYIRSLWERKESDLQKTINSGKPLAKVEAEELSGLLKQDSANEVTSAILTFADAVGRLEKGAWSWSVVKLYYSVFFATRALLGYENIAVAYLMKKPIILHVQAGKRPQRPVGRKNGTTHGVVFSAWTDHFPNSPISNFMIDETLGFDWLKDKRELCNYKQCGLLDPHCPDFLEMVRKNGARKCLAQYKSSHDYFAQDPDHSMLALPYLIVNKAIEKAHENIDLDSDWDEKIRQARLLMRDEKGPIDCFSI